jgi:predicted nucleotidyltransferase
MDTQALIDRVTAAFQADDRAIALVIFGSHAAERADRFSDLDFGVITRDDALDDLVADLRDLVTAGGSPLFAEDFATPTNLHVIYADGSTAEFIVLAESDLLIEGPCRVLFDGSGAVERALLRTPPEPDPAAHHEDVRRLIVWFWHDLEHLIAAIGRGQTWWAFGQLDELRRLCLNLARAAEGAEIEADEAYWKVDEAISQERLKELEDTIAPFALDQILAAAGRLLSWYRSIAPALAAANDIAYPAELDRVITAQFDGLADPGGRQA